MFTLNELSDNENIVKLQMKTQIVGVNFYYRFELVLLDSQCARDYFLLPLLYSNAEYQIREAELIKIIQTKDRELDDYRTQGFKLTRSMKKNKTFYNY